MPPDAHTRHAGGGLPNVGQKNVEVFGPDDDQLGEDVVRGWTGVEAVALAAARSLPRFRKRADTGGRRHETRHGGVTCLHEEPPSRLASLRMDTKGPNHHPASVNTPPPPPRTADRIPRWTRRPRPRWRHTDRESTPAWTSRFPSRGPWKPSVSPDTPRRGPPGLWHTRRGPRRGVTCPACCRCPHSLGASCSLLARSQISHALLPQRGGAGRI